MSIAFLRPALLTSLLAGPQHGYGLLRDVETLSDGRLSPPVGSLYRVIDALVRDGLIVEDHSELVDGRQRRYYRLTPAGRRELSETADLMSSVARVAKKGLGGAAEASDLSGAHSLVVSL